MNADTKERLKYLTLKELFTARDAIVQLLQLGLADLELLSAVKQEIETHA